MSRATPSTIASSLAEGAARLGEAGVDSARHDAELLLAAVLGTDRLSLYVEPKRPVDGAAAARYRELIDRRTGHEPVQYILGWEEFRGLRLTVTPDRKSTRLNSSHDQISYAVFCLKKKKKTNTTPVLKKKKKKKNKN